MFFESLQKVLQARGLFSLQNLGFSPLSAPFPPKCNPKPRFQTPFLQNVVWNLGFRPLSFKMWSKTWVSDPFLQKPRFQTPFFQNVVQNLGFRPLSSKMWSLEARKRAVPFSWPQNDENEAFLAKNYIKKFQGFKICFLKAFKKFYRQGAYSLISYLFTSSHMLHLLTSHCQKLPRRSETSYRCDLGASSSSYAV